MTNVKISRKGQAFLSKGFSAMELAKKIATEGAELTSKDGLVLTIGNQRVAVKRVAQKAVNVK